MDQSGQYQIPDEQILIYFTYAQRWAAARHPSLKRTTVSIDADTYIGILPDNLYRISGVFTDTKELEESMSFRLKSDEWCLVSDTEIKIGDVDAETVTLLYMGEYPAVANDGDTIPGPIWLEEPLFNYTVSRLLSHLAVGSGDLSQYDTRTDSGNPEHNPLLRLAEHYEQMAERSLNKRQIR